MFEAIKHGLGNLLNFKGRDARQAFWYYVLFVWLVTTGISLIVNVPLMLEAGMSGFREGMAAGRSGDPAVVQAVTEASIAHSMMDIASSTMWVKSVSAVLTVLLLGAALVRRLHDSEMSGWWALVPGSMQIANLFVAPIMMRRMIETMNRMQTADPMAGMRSMQSSMSSASVLGLVAILAVIALGIRQSTPGPNRYGEAPFTV